MKRDMELIRKIVLNCQSSEPNANVEGYDSWTVTYHKYLLVQAGLAEGPVLEASLSSTKPFAAVHLHHLTWEGHEFADVVADQSNWKTIKQYINDAGKVLNIETIKFAAKQLFEFVVT
ncbi:DUF2513 domain-containing protein [Marinobacter hydrocarbonoclasticus]|nr:DUF2513 domain-containing protein [Marinobacter nauticus]